VKESGNVGIARHAYDVLNRGEIDAALEHFAPEIVWHTYLVPGPGGGVYRGLEEVRQLWQDVRNVFVEFQNQPERFFDTAEGLVVFVRFIGRGRTSGADVEASLAHVFKMRDGLVTEVRTYDDREQALRDAGVGG
jgi:uncharacterized protein